MHINKKFREEGEKNKSKRIAIITITGIFLIALSLWAYSAHWSYSKIGSIGCRLKYGEGAYLRYRVPEKYTECSCNEGYIPTSPIGSPKGLKCETPLQICKNTNRAYTKAKVEAVKKDTGAELKINCE